MIQVNRIYLIFNRLVTKKFLVDTSDPMLGFATIRISYHETSPDNEVQLQKKLSL